MTKKRIIPFLLAFIVSMSMVFQSCSSDSDDGGTSGNSQTTSSTADETQVTVDTTGENLPSSNVDGMEENSDINISETLSAPLNFSVVPKDDGLYFLWDNVEGATSYVVYANFYTNDFDDAETSEIREMPSSFKLKLDCNEFAGLNIYFFLVAKNGDRTSDSYAFCPLSIPEIEEIEDWTESDEPSTGETYEEISTPVVRVPSKPIVRSLVFAPSGNALRISWSAVSKATSYNVYRSESAYSTYTKIASNCTEPSFDDTSAKLTKAGKSYYYRISAVNAGGESEKSSFIGTTLTLPKIRVGHSERDSSKNAVGNVVATIGDFEYYSKGSTFTRKSDYAPSVELESCGTFKYLTRYHYKKSDGTTKWTDDKDRGTYSFVPSKIYKIDCLTGKITVSDNLTIEK